ncbi:hypothetical protein GUJ93_ZPchr0004g38612 [Zizania palustris]|uniref:DUF4408 domain-containing protein n=1 Tax=Zizania palustris TaxID=103762 RepID=A0A8J5T453_ZIZPA|nr:hypothetical protein GUJ93_ZPchr0004g38612 [Zizania palustris]KAG8066712.1 hypothetical protein GUJ93_ZPchr0004g38612 [Zizania palustris]KAG8066713.1 hypothetical protein GUJ93_ZPchr0004g38612 [Zizania palustris]
MSYSYASRRRGGGGGGGGLVTTLLAAKVVFALAALAAATSFARLAVPQLVAVAGAVFPRVWAAARLWLVPPYLFVTVHLIIVVIWKLSDNKHFQAQQQQQLKDPWPNHPPHPPPVAILAAEDAASLVKPKEEFGVAAEYGSLPESEASPEISPDSGGGESCVTTEADEDASSAASYISDARRSLAPAQEHSALEREFSLPPPVAATPVGSGDDDDDLDATWKAIMQKTRPAAAAAAMAPPPAQKTPPPPRARDPSIGAEEMNRRFDDFIKKNRHSFGRK